MSRYFRIYTCNTKFITDKAVARQNMLKLAVYEAEHDGLCLQLPVPADSAGCKSNGINVDYLYGGRPYLPFHPDIFISISHSGDYLVMALSDFSIGVDIQEHRSVSESVWERFYPAEDSAMLSSIKDSLQRDDFSSGHGLSARAILNTQAVGSAKASGVFTLTVTNALSHPKKDHQKPIILSSGPLFRLLICRMFRRSFRDT